MNKCAIIIPYFGEKWPEWFPLYLKSAEQNKQILDIFFITNITPPLSCQMLSSNTAVSLIIANLYLKN